MHKVFTTTKADFQPCGLAVKKRLQIKRCAAWVFFPTDGSRGQRAKVLVDISLLGLLEGFALETAIKIATGAVWMCHAPANSAGRPGLQRGL